MCENPRTEAGGNHERCLSLKICARRIRSVCAPAISCNGNLHDRTFLGLTRSKRNFRLMSPVGHQQSNDNIFVVCCSPHERRLALFGIFRVLNVRVHA
jgi:hypothetical protein